MGHNSSVPILKEKVSLYIDSFSKGLRYLWKPT
ncbi:MAG: hypothetical protein BWY85_00490 [Firmicutes bacterium ADurb.Bin506]|nr:MAG: hypothetical protein BWY85_00490 [Firmicutes bacterium ADurb.Bin506]